MMMTAQSVNARRNRGFTLIEVLIAMTLLSLMVVLLFGSLKICADSWEKGESKIAQVNEVAVVYHFFQRHLAVAKPLRNNSQDDNRLTFQGGNQTVQFVSEFPASAGKAVPQLFALELKEQAGERLIQVTLTPFFAAAEGQDFTPAPETITLVNQVKNFTLAYFGAEDNAEDGVGSGIWQSEWLDRNSQPQLVKINIELENGIFWPEMIIALKVTALNDASGLENTGEENDTIEEGI
jgi:general secretion pathway protein J